MDNEDSFTVLKVVRASSRHSKQSLIQLYVTSQLLYWYVGKLFIPNEFSTQRAFKIHISSHFSVYKNIIDASIHTSALLLTLIELMTYPTFSVSALTAPNRERTGELFSLPIITIGNLFVRFEIDDRLP